MLDYISGVKRSERNRMEPSGTEWNRAEPSGTEWNRAEPSGTEWNRMKSTIPTSNGQGLIQFME